MLVPFIYIWPNSQKHACIDSKTVSPARSLLTIPLARRLAPPHARGMDHSSRVWCQHRTLNSKPPADRPVPWPCTQPGRDGPPPPPRFKVASLAVPGSKRKHSGHVFCEIAQISRPKRLQGAKLSQRWPKHAAPGAPCPFEPCQVPFAFKTEFAKTCPHCLKDSSTGQKSSDHPLARRLAPHACTWHGPLQLGAMSTQNPQTRFNFTTE